MLKICKKNNFEVLEKISTWSIFPFTKFKLMTLITSISTSFTPTLATLAMVSKDTWRSFLGRLKRSSKNAIILIFSAKTVLLVFKNSFKKIKLRNKCFYLVFQEMTIFHRLFFELVHIPFVKSDQKLVDPGVLGGDVQGFENWLFELMIKC